MDVSNTMASNQTLQPDELRLSAWLRDAGLSKEEFPHTDEAWVELANDAARAGLAGLVLEHATRTNVELPDVCTQRLRAAAMAVAVRNVNMMRELERVVRTFDRARVAILLLKGAALNLTVYQRSDQRPMSDLDLLVRPASAHHALELLKEHGCEAGYDLIRDDFFPKYHYEVELFTGGARPVRIDLHARPFRPLRLARTMPADALWHEANTIGIGEAEALIPRPELMLLQLAAHAAFHGCSRLLWLYDIKRLVNHYGSSIDWALVTQCASRWQLSCAVSYAIERTEELLGSVCPPSVRAEFRTHQANWQDRWTLAQAPRDAASPLAHVLCNVLCTPGVRFRAGYLMAHLFPGPKHLATIYPYRHPGWPVCAHVWRASRVLVRVILSPGYVVVAALKRVVRRYAQRVHDEERRARLRFARLRADGQGDGRIVDSPQRRAGQGRATFTLEPLLEPAMVNA